MTDECKSLQVPDWCFFKMRWIRAHHAYTLVPAAVHPASTRKPQSHLSTSLSQAWTWGGGRGIAVPHLSIKHFNMWLGTKPGLSTHWISGIMKSAEELAQFGTAPDIPPKLCTCPLTCWELLWASAAPEICCLPYRDQNWLSFMTQNKSLLRKRCLVEESLFAVFLFNEIMHKTYKIYLCYWWNFDENWNHTWINLIVFSLKFDIYFLDPVIDNHSYSAV